MVGNIGHGKVGWRGISARRAGFSAFRSSLRELFSSPWRPYRKASSRTPKETRPPNLACYCVV